MKHVSCYFYRSKELGGSWSPEGCRLVSSSSNNSKDCECDHLTHFALLSVYDKVIVDNRLLFFFFGEMKYPFQWLQHYLKKFKSNVKFESEIKTKKAEAEEKTVTSCNLTLSSEPGSHDQWKANVLALRQPSLDLLLGLFLFVQVLISIFRS